MRYLGWNFERTLLADLILKTARRREVLDARVVVPTRDAGNIPNDVRVVVKPAWNLYDAELPSQVYAIEHSGDSTAFRVMFRADLWPDRENRFGIVYDNGRCVAPHYDCYMHAQCPDEQPLAWTIDNRHYRIDCEGSAGQPRNIQLKMFFEEALYPKDITPINHVQEGLGIVFASIAAGTVVTSEVTAANVRDFKVVGIENGPIFCAITRRGTLCPPGAPPSFPPPIVEIKTFFLDETPYFVVEQAIHFPADTSVFGVYLDIVTIRSDRFSHYSFRPVSPSLGASDIEEMGHVIVDPEYLGGMPDGDMLGHFLPEDLAWQSFIRIYKGSHADQFAYTSIDLGARHSGPEGSPAVKYRPACHLERDRSRGTTRFFRAPIYVRNRTVASTIVRIPAGTTYRQRVAYCSSAWNALEFAGEIEALGRRLNNPASVSVHPLFLGDNVVGAQEAMPLFGSRADAYLRGVR